MSRDEIRALMLDVLMEVAPEVEPSEIQTNVELRDQIDIDSMVPSSNIHNICIREMEGENTKNGFKEVYLVVSRPSLILWWMSSASSSSSSFVANST